MAVTRTRTFRFGDRGPDVEAVARALARARVPGNRSLVVLALLPKRIRQTWGRRKEKDLKRFQASRKLPVTGAYDQATHEKLVPHFDARARWLMRRYPIECQWARLVAAMKEVSGQTTGYSLGAGHGAKLAWLKPSGWFDCSSSTSYVLWRAGIFPSDVAWNSTKLTAYGEPGKGKWFTVWSRAGYGSVGHVWIQIHRHPPTHWRFDTSPDASGETRRGPRLRLTPRFTTGFTARHWPGM